MRSDINPCNVGGAFVFHDIQRVGEFAVAHRRAGLHRVFERQKQLFGAFDGLGGAVELDPAFARGGLDAQFLFERLQVLRVVVVKAAARAGRFRNAVFQWPWLKVDLNGAGSQEHDP